MTRLTSGATSLPFQTSLPPDKERGPPNAPVKRPKLRRAGARYLLGRARRRGRGLCGVSRTAPDRAVGPAQARIVPQPGATSVRFNWLLRVCSSHTTTRGPSTSTSASGSGACDRHRHPHRPRRPLLSRLARPTRTVREPVTTRSVTWEAGMQFGFRVRRLCECIGCRTTVRPAN